MSAKRRRCAAIILYIIYIYNIECVHSREYRQSVVDAPLAKCDLAAHTHTHTRRRSQRPLPLRRRRVGVDEPVPGRGQRRVGRSAEPAGRDGPGVRRGRGVRVWGLGGVWWVSADGATAMERPPAAEKSAMERPPACRKSAGRRMSAAAPSLAPQRGLWGAI